MESLSGVSTPAITDAYIYPTNPGWIGFDFPNVYNNNGVLFYYFSGQSGWETFNGNTQLSSANNESENTWYVMSGSIAPDGTSQLSANYSALINSGSGFCQSSSGNLYVGDNGGTGTMQWIRMRNYPPGGTLPAVSLGAIGCS